MIPILYLLFCTQAASQGTADKVDISFGIKAWDPVRLKIDEKTGSAFSSPIRFTAVNSTYYPFMISIDFIQFENLSPTPAPRSIKVDHGSNNLFTFSIHVPGMGYGYRFSYTYWLKPADVAINGEFPYLIPLKEGNPVVSMKTPSGKLSDSFSGKAGDTVFCMRRGIATAVPRSETMDFRLSGHDCLEVLHDDGTYMIYHFLMKNDNLTAPGKIVLPGQPVGRISDSSYIRVELLKIINTDNLMFSQPIRYTTGKAGTLLFDQIDGIEKSVHPKEIISLEMKSRELKQTGRKR
ncbi:MAG: hypothetical protein WAL29_03070 [Bacteroidales bacterium]